MSGLHMSPLAESLLVDSIKDDPEVKQRAKALAMKSLEVADRILTTAMPSVQIQVLRVIMPVVGRALQSDTEDSEIAQLRQDVNQMYAELHGDTGEHTE